MIVRYSNGYQIPINVIKALRYLGKVGVMSTKDWHQFFCYTKHSRWQEKQLSYIHKLGYIKHHSADSVKGVWILTDKGRDLLHEHKWPDVLSVPAHHIDHDTVVGRSLLTLQKEKYVQSWMVERELKMINQKEFMLSNKDGEIKYPDAIFKLSVDGDLNTVALEYEKNGKSQTRYRSMLWNYAGLTNISLILFVCEDDRIIRRIESAFSYLKQPELYDRLAIVNAIDWKTSPLTAPIKMNRGIFKLKDVCNTYSELLAS